ncbi:MAG TPA: hypothetical protein VIY48_01005 [Candidatus Paceibacterota bacterium]
MTNEEKNSAELEAEEILKGAYAEARAEECPQGEECSVHFRVDDQFIEENSQCVRLITYVGDYCVVTDDNQQAVSPLELAMVVIGATSAADLPPRWETFIVYVGEGVLADVSEMPLEERRKAFRYSATHDVWDELVAVHDGTVSFLKAGLIDVSKPLEA